MIVIQRVNWENAFYRMITVTLKYRIPFEWKPIIILVVVVTCLLLYVWYIKTLKKMINVNITHPP